MVVEPDLAPCLFESATQGKPTSVVIEAETIMAGLSCGEVSELAWEILSVGTDDFVTISDDLVAPVMRLLAASPYGDPPVVAGESAVAGLAALLVLSTDAGLRADTGLDEKSRILLFSTEGATDPLIYERLVRQPLEVVATAGQAG